VIYACFHPPNHFFKLGRQEFADPAEWFELAKQKARAYVWGPRRALRFCSFPSAHRQNKTLTPTHWIDVLVIDDKAGFEHFYLCHSETIIA
jgi:hypothetical protein